MAAPLPPSFAPAAEVSSAKQAEKPALDSWEPPPEAVAAAGLTPSSSTAASAEPIRNSQPEPVQPQMPAPPPNELPHPAPGDMSVSSPSPGPAAAAASTKEAQSKAPSQPAAVRENKLSFGTDLNRNKGQTGAQPGQKLKASLAAQASSKPKTTELKGVEKVDPKAPAAAEHKPLGAERSPFEPRAAAIKAAGPTPAEHKTTTLGLGFDPKLHPAPVETKAAEPPAPIKTEPLLFAVDSPGGDRELSETQIAEEITKGSISE
ncbi:MAG TPA: hypothetical protein VFQ61_26525, partial [Polyangiaceae bacterium]|nr:hypothetical protein [Polyangiaceae bacterium]